MSTKLGTGIIKFADERFFFENEYSRMIYGKMKFPSGLHGSITNGQHLTYKNSLDNYGSLIDGMNHRSDKNMTPTANVKFRHGDGEMPNDME